MQSCQNNKTTVFKRPRIITSINLDGKKYLKVIHYKNDSRDRN